MSATNRGATRTPRDFYATPERTFRPLLDVLPRDVAYWEPAAGDGRLIRWLRESGRQALGADLCAAPGTPRSLVFNRRDFLKDRQPRQFILTNPPFSLGLKFCQHAVEVAPEILFLLPLNFLGALYRREWFRAHEPNAIFVITPRPSFGLNKHGKKGTDANEYGWFYWGERWNGIRHL